MPPPPDELPPGQDEMDRGLHEIIAGLGGEAAVREPSAAERARRPAQPAPGKRLGWRNARKARQLRKPVREHASGRSRFRSRRPGRAAPAGRGQAGPQRHGRRWRRARSVAKRIAVLALFAGLVFGLHLLGFGPH